MKKKNVVAIIPARGGSKGIPYKNIKKLNGKPLIYFTINTLRKINKIDRIIVSTEDKKIREIVKYYFPKIEIIDRPQRLASDTTTMLEVVKYVSSSIKTDYYFPDFILQVAPTCPFIKKESIEKIIDALKSNKSDCAVSLKRIEHEHPYRAKKLNIKSKKFNNFKKNINVEKFMSRKDLPELYCTSGSIYGRSYNLVQTYDKKNKSFCFGKSPYGVIVDDIEAINIDREIDFDFAGFISKKYKIK